MQGLEEDASKVEMRIGNAKNCGTEETNTCSQHVGTVEDGIEDRVPHDY